MFASKGWTCAALMLSAVLLLSAAQGAAGEEKAAASKNAETAGAPTEVAVGIYVNQIYSTNMKENSFTVDFYAWFRWKGDDIKPLESFELVNGRIEKKDVLDSKKIGDVNYAACRTVAIVTKFYDITRFPLDSHTLTIEIEDGANAEQKLKYVADVENCGVDPKFVVPGYVVTKSTPLVSSHVYKTNYGDISLPSGNASSYSNFAYSIDIARPDTKFFTKLFWSVFVSVLIAFLAFFVKPTDLDPRFGLGIGAIFAATASSYVISSYLPDTNVLTMADKINFTAIAFIFASLAQSTYSLKLATTGREEEALKLDRTSFVVFLAAYIVCNVVVVLTA